MHVYESMLLNHYPFNFDGCCPSSYSEEKEYTTISDTKIGMEKFKSAMMLRSKYSSKIDIHCTHTNLSQD